MMGKHFEYKFDQRNSAKTKNESFDFCRIHFHHKLFVSKSTDALLFYLGVVAAIVLFRHVVALNDVFIAATKVAFPFDEEIVPQEIHDNLLRTSMFFGFQPFAKNLPFPLNDAVNG